MPDGRRRRARLDAGSLPGDARKRRRGRQRRDARRARLAIIVFVIAGFCVFGGIFGAPATAVFVDHLPKLSRLGPIALGENSTVYTRHCTKKPCSDQALGVIARVENRVSVRWKDIAPTMRSATVAVEDKRYWQHGALDWQGIARAAINNLQAGGIPAGRLDDLAAAREESLPAAGGEQPLDQPQDRRGLDRRPARRRSTSKAEILTAYMNTVFYGGERVWRRGRCAHLLRQEARSSSRCRRRPCSPACRRRRPPTTRSVHPDAARHAAREVLARPARVALDQRRRLRGRAQRAARASSAAATARPLSSPFVFDQVRQALNARLPAKLAARGGLRVYSTVDQRLQFAARRSIKDVLNRPAIRRPPWSPSTCTTAMCGARHLRLRLGREPVQPGHGRAPLAGLDVQALRTRRRAPPRCRPGPGSSTRPATSRSPRTTRSARSRTAGLPHNADERRRGLHEPRDRDEPLGQRGLRAAHARSDPGASGGDRTSPRDPLEAPAALLDGARRRRGHAARADERLRDDRRGAVSTTRRA